MEIQLIFTQNNKLKIKIISDQYLHGDFITHLMEPPYVIKPVNEGSSVGVHLVMNKLDRSRLSEKDFPDRVLVEKFIPGHELTTTVMGSQPLGVTDIITEKWYDYDAKYQLNASKHVVPADIPREVYEACEDFAVRAHLALGCKGISRADFRWDNNLGVAGLYLLEINTQPGMTPTSLSPEQAKAKGISFDDFCNWILEDASVQPFSQAEKRGSGFSFFQRYRSIEICSFGYIRRRLCSQLVSY